MSTYPQPAHQQEFEQALDELREVFDSRMEHLYRLYEISKGDRPIDWPAWGSLKEGNKGDPIGTPTTLSEAGGGRRNSTAPKDR